MLGYDLTTAQLTGIDYDNHMSAGGRVPEIILVRDGETGGNGCWGRGIGVPGFGTRVGRRLGGRPRAGGRG